MVTSCFTQLLTHCELETKVRKLKKTESPLKHRLSKPGDDRILLVSPGFSTHLLWTYLVPDNL